MCDSKPRQADTIEITPEMIEAGVKILRVSGRLEFDGSDDPLLVSQILDAVFGLGRRQVLEAHSRTD